MTSGLEMGPLLAGVLGAQRTDERATAYPHLQTYAHALAGVAAALDDPIVWPVGAAAERLAGAAVLISSGRVRLRGWSDLLDGERVLLVAVAAVTPLSLLAAARHAKELGAELVHACGVDIGGIEHSGVDEWIKSYAALGATRSSLTPLAVA